MSRLLLVSALLATLLYPAIAAAGPEGKVWKSPTCHCCSKWVDHMAANGFRLEANDTTTRELVRIRAHVGLKPDQAACHTAIIDGYVIEGHVPATDVTRLLAERPDALGLSVPGMPVGSPGMEQGDEKEPYEVLLVRRDGTTEVFARH